MFALIQLNLHMRQTINHQRDDLQEPKHLAELEFFSNTLVLVEDSKQPYGGDEIASYQQENSQQYLVHKSYSKMSCLGCIGVRQDSFPLDGVSSPFWDAFLLRLQFVVMFSCSVNSHISLFLDVALLVFSLVVDDLCT